MAILFDWYELPEPKDKQREEKILHPRIRLNGSTTTDELRRRIQERSSLTETDVSAVLDALSHVMGEDLAEGRQVHLDGIGYFYPVLTSTEPVTAATKRKTTKIKLKGIKFRADQVLKNEIGAIKAKPNPDAKVQSQYANSFTDQAKGKAIANQMYSNGADIVFTCGGDVGTGAIEAAKENGKYAIGVDRDQSDLAPENVLTSAIKRVDAGVFETVKSYVNGTFKGGTTTTYGLEENAVGVPDTTKNLVSQEILDLVEETITKLKNKEITVPKNEEEYNAMVK